RRAWLDRDEFLDGVALGQTMPGPLAAQVSMWVGYLRAGAAGALAVAGAFIAPSFLFVLGVAAIYAHYQGLAVVQSLFYGIALGGWAASGGTQVALGLFFLKAGAFIFGSGLAIVPFLREGVVHQHHWLSERQFLDAVAMGLITPGPVVITATFIGYLVGGLAGAVVATLAIFTPIYLGVVVPGCWFVRRRSNRQV